MQNFALVSQFLKTGGLFTISPPEPDDLFIACASFEPRSSCLAECMIGGYHTKKSAIYVNREFLGIDSTSSNVEVMSKHLVQSSEHFLGVSIGSWEDATAQFRILRKLLAPDGIREEPLRITVDISTFNREALIACLTILRWAYPNSCLRLAYVSPQEYNPSGRATLQEKAQGEIANLDPAVIQENVWLSRGFRKLRNAIGFPGFQKPNLPSLLILLPGYEVERPLTLVDNLEPSIVFLGKPIDSTKDEFYDRSLQSKDQMLRLFKARQPVHEFEFSCKVIDKTFNALKALVEKHYESHNIFLTSFSTKPTLIAELLLAEKFDKLQLTSSIPGEYNVTDYSQGTHEVSFFVMPQKLARS